MRQYSLFRPLFLVCLLTLAAAFIALPDQIFTWSKTKINFYLFGKQVYKDYQLKQGLDIQGGMQVTLEANMSQIAEADREVALEAAREVIARRVDLYGISESVIQTAQKDDQYRLIVELPGVFDANQALSLVGQTALLEFKLQNQLDESVLLEATASPQIWLNSFVSTGLTGASLQRAQAQLDPQTSKPIIVLEMNESGRELFAAITKENVDQVLAVFIDGMPIMTPVISSPILDGRAVISGDFTIEEAKNLAIQLNAGALPVEIKVLEQKNIGASLGEASINQSIKAGLIGLALVLAFMVLYYGWLGAVAGISLLIYATLTIALYKVFGVVLTLPGVAGMILTIGMAVDSNILTFERMKEELRAGQPLLRALELGFGRAWDSIKDANLASIFTALVLINPLNLSFLSTSGLVKGFGLTFLIGTLLSIFTGVFISRLLLRAVARILVRGKQQ
jgi:preprotein translocase subunit SecD